MKITASPVTRSRYTVHDGVFVDGTWTACCATKSDGWHVLPSNMTTNCKRCLARKLPAPKPQPPSDVLTARVCTFCGKGKGTICYRQDGGTFFAHLKCLRAYRRQQAEEVRAAARQSAERTRRQAEAVQRVLAEVRRLTAGWHSLNMQVRWAIDLVRRRLRTSNPS